MTTIEKRHGVLHLYGHKHHPIQVQTVGDTLQAVGCGCVLHLETATGHVSHWEGPEKLRSVVLTQIYYLWPELKKKGQYQPLALKPQSKYTIKEVNAIALTSLVLTWGAALVLAILFPIQTLIWGLLGLVQRFLVLCGFALTATTYFDYWWYHRQYGLRPNETKEEAPCIDAEPEVMVRAELQNLWNSVRPLTMDDGQVYRIFDTHKVRQLRRFESRLSITLPLEDSGWALVDINQDVAQENALFEQTRGRYQMPLSLSV